MKSITPPVLVFLAFLSIYSGPVRAIMIEDQGQSELNEMDSIMDGLQDYMTQPLPRPTDIPSTTKKDIPHHLWVATQYLKKAEFDSVVIISRQILSLEENHIEAHALLGAAFKGKGEEEQFKKEAALIKKMAPGSPLIFLNLATVYLARHDPSNAELAYKQGIQSSAEKTMLRMGLASLYVKQGKTEQAYEQYQKVLKTSGVPEQHVINASFSLCQIDLQNKEYDRAITQANSIINLYPVLPHGYRCLATAQIKKGNYEPAVEAYKKLMITNPASPVPFQELALIYSDENQNQKTALHYATQGAQKFPQMAKSQDVLGWIYLNSKDYQKALIQFQLASDLHKNNPDYHYHTGLSYQKLGQVTKAKAAFERALELTNEQQAKAFSNELRRRIEQSK